MNRRLFIRVSGWVSLMIGFMPQQLSASQKNHKKYLFVDLPEVRTHSRHGLLRQFEQSDFAHSPPSWLTNYQKDVFFKDGFGKSESDLIHISLKINQEIINLGIDQNEYFVSQKENTTSYSLEKNELIPFYCCPKYKGEMIRIKNSKIINTPTGAIESLILPVDGNFTVNEKSIDENSGILLQNSSGFKIQSEKEAIAFLIHKF